MGSGRQNGPLKTFNNSVDVEERQGLEMASEEGEIDNQLLIRSVISRNYSAAAAAATQMKIVWQIIQLTITSAEGCDVICIVPRASSPFPSATLSTLVQHANTLS